MRVVYIILYSVKGGLTFLSLSNAFTEPWGINVTESVKQPPDMIVAKAYQK